MALYPSLDLPTLPIVLYEPEIPANTGNIIRLSACLNTSLHLIHPLGFSIDDKGLKRAGLDYHDLCAVFHYKNINDFLQQRTPRRLIALSSKKNTSLWDFVFEDGDYLLFGPETRGLDEATLNLCQHHVRIPMSQQARSLNLSNSVAIVAYEAARQIHLKSKMPFDICFS